VKDERVGVTGCFGVSGIGIWVFFFSVGRSLETTQLFARRRQNQSNRLERDDGDGVRATMEENIQVFFTSVVFAFRRPSCHKKRERGCQVLHVLLAKSVELSAFCLHRETCEEEESGFEEEEEEEDNEWAARSTSHHHHQPTVRSRTNEEDLPMHLYPGTKSPNNILSSFSGSPSRLCFSRAACCVCVCVVGQAPIYYFVFYYSQVDFVSSVSFVS